MNEMMMFYAELENVRVISVKYIQTYFRIVHAKKG